MRTSYTGSPRSGSSMHWPVLEVEALLVHRTGDCGSSAQRADEAA